jgi:DNA (cytosine-5)-methyltransferase 1
VFVVGYFGDWRPAAAVLFERHSLSGNSAPSREKRKKIATVVGDGTAISYDMKQHHNPQPSGTVQLTTKNCSMVRGDTPLVQPSYGIPGNWIGRKPENGGNATEPMHDIAPCLTKTDQHGVAQTVYEMHGQDSRVRDLGDTCTTVTSKWGTGGGNVPVTTQTMAVRRLTCVECERLQGFPDNYTDIKTKKKQTPDGPRYKALGNSMAVPVMRWIGERIQKFENQS